MGILDTLAVKISGQAREAISETERTAQAMDKAALAQAKLATAAAQLEQAQAKVAVVEAKAAGDADRLTVAQERLAVAQQRVSTTRAEEGVAKATVSYNAASKEVQGLEKSVGGAEKALSSIGQSAGGIAGVVIAADAAQLAAAKMAVGAAEAAADLGEEVTQFERLSGASAEQASRFLYASKQLGLGADTTANALFRLGHNVEGSDDKLAKLGIRVAYTKDGQIDLLATLENVAAAYQDAGGGAKGSEIAFAAFGKSAKDLIPLLAKNRDELHKLYAETPKSEIVSDAEQARDRQFKEDIHQLTEEMKSLEIAGGKALMPFIDANVKAMTKLASMVEKVLGPVEKFLSWLGVSVGSTKDLGAASSTTAGQVDDLTASLLDQAAAAAKAAPSLSDQLGAVQGLEAADRQVTETQKALTEAQDGYAKKARDVADANNAIQKAALDVKDAEQAVADARRNAPRDLAKAKEDEAAGVHSIADATDDLAVATAKYGAESRQAADAADKVAAAKSSHADAVDKLNDLQRDPNRAVEEAEQRLTDAKQAQVDAQQKLNTAKKEDPAADIANAEQAARDATIAREIAYEKLLAMAGAINTALGTTVDLTDTSASNLANIVNAILQALQTAASPEGFGKYVPGPGAPGSYGGPRAAGGPVSAGDYLIGEKGPEMLHLGPTSSGVITSNADLNRQEPNVININVAVPSGTDSTLAQRVADEVGWSIRSRGLN